MPEESEFCYRILAAGLPWLPTPPAPRGLGGHGGSWRVPPLSVMRLRGFSSPAQGFAAWHWVKVAGHSRAWPWGEEKGCSKAEIKGCNGGQRANK